MTLFIAESNDRVRERLASIAASVEGLSVVGKAGDAGIAIGGIKRVRPDSVIVALPMSGGSGLDVLSVAKSTNPSSVAIVLTQAPCSECQRNCVARGADYFFEKSWETKKIVTALVLLAHHSYQDGFGAWQEAEQHPIRSVLLPSNQSELFPVRLPAGCPRITASSTPAEGTCFLAANAYPGNVG